MNIVCLTSYYTFGDFPIDLLPVLNESGCFLFGEYYCFLAKNKRYLVLHDLCKKQVNVTSPDERAHNKVSRTAKRQPPDEGGSCDLLF